MLNTKRMHLLLLCVGILNVSLNSAWAGDWIPEGEVDGVKLYSQKSEGIDVVLVKGEGVIQAPIEEVTALIIDEKRATEWVDHVSKSTLVRRTGPFDYVNYNQISMPFPFQNRDSLVRVHVDVNVSEKRVTVDSRSIEDPEIPQKSTLVRTQVHQGRFELVAIENRTQTRMTAIVQADPGGELPKFVVNTFQKDWPVNTFKGVRKAMAQPARDRPEGCEEIFKLIAQIK